MPSIRKDACMRIRRLFFLEHVSLENIAERLGVSGCTVRRALVIDAGTRPGPERGPFHKENNS
jgi:DNA-binding transcriptional regulator LsrR (DeoR family)